MKIDPANLNWRDTHELWVGSVLPRPIAFVSTVGQTGVFNLAPFSFFTILSVKPAVAGFHVGRKRDGQKKDTLANIEYGKDFVINIVTEALKKPMNQSSAKYPSNVDENNIDYN